MLPVLVLGVGNILLKDEGVGVHAVRELTARAERGGSPRRHDVELYDGGTFGIDLLDTIANRRKVIVIDAVRPVLRSSGAAAAKGGADAAPGTVLRFTAADLVRPGRPDLSLHQVGLFETLAMARQLGCAPEEVVIFGVVPMALEPGLELSPEVAAVVPRVIDLVLAELKNNPGTEGQGAEGKEGR
jgi:hydrogenase maturation protease